MILLWTLSWAEEEAEPELSVPQETVTTPAATQQRVIKLSPEVRVIEKRTDVEVIPREAIQQFLIHPRILAPEELEDLGYIVAAAEQVSNATVGMDIYVRNLDSTAKNQNYIIIALGQTFQDQQGEALAHEIVYLGDAMVKKRSPNLELDADIEIPEDLVTLEITKASREIRAGDKILPVEEAEFPEDFYPHPPKALNTDSYIIGVVDQVSEIGQYQIVVINRGADDNIERGHMLAIEKQGRIVQDEGQEQNSIRLPGRKAGTLLCLKCLLILAMP